jgi:hypothetical protein
MVMQECHNVFAYFVWHTRRFHTFDESLKRLVKSQSFDERE